jgi:hypothetical protein
MFELIVTQDGVESRIIIDDEKRKEIEARGYDRNIRIVPLKAQKEQTDPAPQKEEGEKEDVKPTNKGK